ncbi:hypothetical protein DDV93_09905 [Cereibacter johrii]|nr:hypothetical protein DDV93_09905 [Cereibacter johrii]
MAGRCLRGNRRWRRRGAAARGCRSRGTCRFLSGASPGRQARGLLGTATEALESGAIGEIGALARIAAGRFFRRR